MKSPDRADAVTAVIALKEMKAINVKNTINPPWMDFLSDGFREESIGGGVLEGAFAGD